MTYTIDEGSHYDESVFSSWFHFNPATFTKRVRFQESCKYQLPAYNAEDVNKLFGASYGFRGVHHNSARFGWRWSNTAQKIELLTYCYDLGKRNQDEQLRFPVVAQIDIDEEVECTIKVTATEYIFTVKAGDITIGQTVTVNHSKLSFFGITHSLYFGGELSAPHIMRVEMR